MKETNIFFDVNFNVSGDLPNKKIIDSIPETINTKTGIHTIVR